jgi:hypothetical protein
LESKSTTGSFATLLATIAMPVPICPDPTTPNDFTVENLKRALNIDLNISIDANKQKEGLDIIATAHYLHRSRPIILEKGRPSGMDLLIGL